MVEAEELTSIPSVAIGTIPADKPIEQNMREILATLLRHTKAEMIVPRTLLEMAYKPRQTALMQMAQDAGWTTIPGLEVLSAQGWYQYQKWTGIRPLFEDARTAVTVGNENEL